ncbi:MAG: phage portal protein [Dehalococcoidia bacterium]|nr:MAG: phage portal protein [Dehalococcoidia bacterium]
MGLIADALQGLVRGTRPPPFPVSGSLISPVSPTADFQGYSRAYMRNEIVFACIEMLATSAGEPHIIGRRWQRSSPTFRATMRSEESRLMAKGLSMRDAKEQMVRNGFFREMPDHPLVRLLNNPNPFMSRGQMWGTVVMDRALAGNAYLLKARVAGGPMEGAVAELWRLRPDRVKIIPDPKTFISGYEYRTGAETITLPPQDVMHFKTRNPLNDYYGMPPLMAIAGRIDIDEYQKGFLRSFYEQGGAGPGSILTIKQKLNEEQKEEIRGRFKHRFGGPRGVHEMLILDSAESTYTQMGLNRGLRDALPKEIDEVTESRIASAFGIPPDLLGLLVGMQTSSYANRRVSWAVFWDLTMVPLLSDLDDVLNLSIIPDFTGIDEVTFDLSSIRALNEEVDKIHDRWRKDLLAGAVSLEEFREAVGLDPDLEGTLYVPSNVGIHRKREDEELAAPPVPPALPSPPEGEPVVEARCPDCRKLLGKNVSGADLWCDRCKKEVAVVSSLP